MRRYLIGFLPVWSVLLVKQSIVLFPQTYGPYNHPLARWLARFILKRAVVVMARDETSRQVVLDLAGPSTPVLLSPDVAFGLPSMIPDKLVFDPPLSGLLPESTIGLNVNGLMYNGGYTRRNMFNLKLDYAAFLQELVSTLLEEHPGEILLVPHTYAPPVSVESDNEACRKLRAALPEDLQQRVRIVAAEYNQQEIKGIIGMCDFFIGSRMHSCIAALSQGIPCIGVAYSRKFKGVFDTVGVGRWVVDARDMEAGPAVEKVVDLFFSRNEIRPSLRRGAATAREKLTAVFGRLAGTVMTSSITN